MSKTDQLRREVHGIIDQMLAEIKYNPMNGYDKVYKDAAVVRIMGRIETIYDKPRAYR